MITCTRLFWQSSQMPRFGFSGNVQWSKVIQTNRGWRCHCWQDTSFACSLHAPLKTRISNRGYWKGKKTQKHTLWPGGLFFKAESTGFLQTLDKTILASKVSLHKGFIAKKPHGHAAVSKISQMHCFGLCREYSFKSRKIHSIQDRCGVCNPDRSLGSLLAEAKRKFEATSLVSLKSSGGWHSESTDLGHCRAREAGCFWQKSNILVVLGTADDGMMGWPCFLFEALKGFLLSRYRAITSAHYRRAVLLACFFRTSFCLKVPLAFQQFQHVSNNFLCNMRLELFWSMISREKRRSKVVANGWRRADAQCSMNPQYQKYNLWEGSRNYHLQKASLPLLLIPIAWTRSCDRVPSLTLSSC